MARLDKMGCLVATIIVLQVGFWIGVVYVAIHFIRKFW